ncbi:MAG: hypothetical protein ABIJ46_01525 [bacterium]
MKCFTSVFSVSEKGASTVAVEAGLQLVEDERFGQVVSLGGKGKRSSGAWQETVRLDRRLSPRISEGRVLDASSRKVTLPARDGKPEKSFFVLERTRRDDGPGVLVRLQGRDVKSLVVDRQPEVVVRGRFSNVSCDDLVLLRPGDKLRVITASFDFVLWLGDDGQPLIEGWLDRQKRLAREKAEAAVAEARAGSKPPAFGRMPAFTFVGGEISSGIRVDKRPDGVRVITLGEAARYQRLAEVPVLMGDGELLIREQRYGDPIQVVEQASVVQVGESVEPAPFWAADKTPKKTPLWSLSDVGEPERGASLVWISTPGPYTKGQSGEIEVWKGVPVVLATGQKGVLGNALPESLIVLREGDVLYVRAIGGYKSDGPWALYVRGGELHTEPWFVWKARDSREDPNFYVAKGTAPAGHVPKDWTGRIVTALRLVTKGSGCGPDKVQTEEAMTGELVRLETVESSAGGQPVQQVVLNLGWDGLDYHETVVEDAVWFRLNPDKKVRRLEGKEAEERSCLRTEAESVLERIRETASRPHFRLVDGVFRRGLERLVALDKSYFDLLSVWMIQGWIRDALKELEYFSGHEEKARELLAEAEGGLPDGFGGDYRIREEDNPVRYWVIRPDGSERQPDSLEEGWYRGTKWWKVVRTGDLAISWRKADHASAHEFTVHHCPPGGCTPAQCRKVERFTADLGRDYPQGPKIGSGWKLLADEPTTPVIAKGEKPVEAVTTEPVDSSSLDLSGLFGGGARVKSRRK